MESEPGRRSVLAGHRLPVADRGNVSAHERKYVRDLCPDIRTSSARTASLLELFEEPAMVLEESGRIREANGALEALAGVEEERLTGGELADLVRGTGPDDGLEPAVAAAAESGAATVPVEFVGGDGRAYELSIRHIGNEGDGAALAAVARGRSAPERNADVLDRISDGFIALDADWRITDANETGARVLREAMGEDGDAAALVGRHLWESVPEAVDTTFYEKYHEAMATGTPVSFEDYYPPLETWFDVRAYPSESGLSVYLSDSTERRRQREDLAARERVLRDIYEIVSDRELSVDAQVQRLLALGRAELGTGYGTLSRIEGEDYVFEIVEAEDDAVEAGDVVPLSATNCEIAASQQESLVLGDVARDAPDETDRTGYAEWGIVCYIGTPVFVEDEVYGTFCFYDTEAREEQFTEWEVTLVDLMGRWVSAAIERRTATERLRRQNDKLQGFASVVSHDLRNPLNVVDASLELAEETGDPEHFERARAAVDRMEALIDDLLTLASSGESIEEREPVALADVLEECWRSVAASDATLVVDTERTVSADVGRLGQLLGNLLGNAVRHGGESVTITVGDCERGFYVADDGPGIPPDEREAVLESGYSTDPEGTGFGLGIVSEIAEAHGWAVSVGESESGGARIEITGDRL